MLTRQQADRMLERMDVMYDQLVAAGYSYQALQLLELQESIDKKAEFEATESAGF